jgi:AcrR family transcriptional regulator
MTSQCHNDVPREPDVQRDPDMPRQGGARQTASAERLLDAARDSILSVGWKRTSLTEVARRAGLSRMTVYRTYPDMASLFGDLMTREWADVVTAVLHDGQDGRDDSWPERLAAAVVGTVGALREDELFQRIVDVDPELLLPYLLDRRGRSQEALLDLLATRIADGQRAGGLRGGDPAVQARALVLAAHGYLLSARTMTDDSVTVADLDAELAESVRRYLAP